MQEDNGYRIHHQVKLPGGKHIEVVYLDNRDAPFEQPLSSTGSQTHETKPATPSSTPSEPLHICPSCGGSLVQPLDWFEESPGQWRLLMRCPDCELLREGAFGEALIERLDDELDRAMTSLLDDLQRITHANMAEEIDLFARALQLDLIGPSDF
jgi:hypothetical protein